MMSRARMSVLVAFLAAMPVAGSGAEEPGTYPIWWSPKLELESLNRIDERLNRNLWPGSPGLNVYKESGSTRVWASMDTCADTIRLTEEGYQTEDYSQLKLRLRLLAECRAIEMLKQARPAKTSYASNFVLDRDAVNYLPPMTSMSPSCEGKCWQYTANQKRIPWGAVGTFLRIDVKSEVEMIVETEGWEDRIEILARADFNGDELEDLILMTRSRATRGTYGAAAMFLLTRETADSVFQVLNAARHLCDNYRC